MKNEKRGWLSSGLLAGRKVTRCQKRTKAYEAAAADLAKARAPSCPPPAMEVYRGTDASGDVHAVVLSGRAPHSYGPAVTAAMMATAQRYQLLMFRFSPDSGRWLAVLAKGGE